MAIKTVGSKGKLVTFSHEDMDDELHILTGLNEIEWGYKLNTATFPTYGGEVVQILSASVEVMNVGGDLTSYEDMINVYSFFYKYFQIASQGSKIGAATGIQKYNQKHMKFTYPERDWEFHIQPMSAPGFHVGLEVVVPSWRISTHVDHFLASDLTDQIKQEASAKAALEGFDADNAKYNPGNRDTSFFKLTEGIGYTESNPFSDPFSSVSGITNEEYLTLGKEAVESNSEYYKLLGPAYNSQDFQSLLYGYDSEPAKSASEGKVATDVLKDNVTK